MLFRSALMYSFPYLEPICCSMFSCNCCFLTCIHVSQEAGQVAWYSHLFQNFPQFIVVHTVNCVGGYIVAFLATIKKAECQRIDVFELWCWRRLLRVPWAARRSNQSILKKINPEYSSEGLMLKLKLQYFGHLMRRADSLEKTLMLGKIEAGEKGKTEDEMVGWYHQLNGHGFGWHLGVGDGWRGLVS